MATASTSRPEPAASAERRANLRLLRGSVALALGVMELVARALLSAPQQTIASSDGVPAVS